MHINYHRRSSPTRVPTLSPTVLPTRLPTALPTVVTNAPTLAPTLLPTPVRIPAVDNTTTSARSGGSQWSHHKRLNQMVSIMQGPSESPTTNPTEGPTVTPTLQPTPVSTRCAYGVASPLKCTKPMSPLARHCSSQQPIPRALQPSNRLPSQLKCLPHHPLRQVCHCSGR
jgi:hypothetical protein